MDSGAILKTLLHQLKDGVIVCKSEGEIILFNRAAKAVFAKSGSLETGGSLYNLCYQPPVEQALSLLRYQHDQNKSSEPLPYVQFLNAALKGEVYFRCRAGLLPPLPGAGNSFVIIFEDISAWYAPDNPLFSKIEGLRAPMANLRAAVESLTEYPEMSPVMQSAFENVLVQESLNLTEAFTSLSSSCDVLMQGQNHLTELSTELLFGFAAQHLRARKISAATSPALNVRARIDVYGLLLVLDFLGDQIRQKRSCKNLSCTILAGEQFIFFDFHWQGEFITTGEIKILLGKQVKHSVGGMTLDAILHSMEADIWSMQRETSESALRLALPIVKKDIT